MYPNGILLCFGRKVPLYVKGLILNEYIDMDPEAVFRRVGDLGIEVASIG